MKRRTLLLSSAPIGLAALLAACSSEDSTTGSGSSDSGGKDGGEAVGVVASTDVWGNIAQTIGGDLVEVTALITDPEADPHEFEASTRNQLALSKATIVIENGGGYDDFVDNMLKTADNADATVLNAVDISGYTAPEGEELNEHVWYDFPTVLAVIDKVTDALGEALADQKDTFTSNADSLKSDIKDLQQKEEDLKETAEGKGVAITEPVPLYMLEAIGLKNKTSDDFSEAIEEGDDVSASVLKETLDLFNDHEVVVLAYNEQTEDATTKKVKKAAEDNDIAVVGVTETLPKGKDYVSWMSENIDALADAIGK